MTRDRASTPAIAGVIFDCDGTLVDSELIHARGVSEILAADHGLMLDATALKREFRGGRFADMIDTLAARHHIDLRPDFVSRYRARVEAIGRRELRPMPGVQAALAAIDQPRCVASSGPYDQILRALSITGLGHHFGDRVFSAYTLGIWKPAPDLFLHAAGVLGIAPAACAVVEDSDVGVEAARRAGMRVFGYDPEGAIGDHPRAQLQRFKDYAHLPGLIAQG